MRTGRQGGSSSTSRQSWYGPATSDPEHGIPGGFKCRACALHHGVTLFRVIQR
jgi:hypothetical protein